VSITAAPLSVQGHFRTKSGSTSLPSSGPVLVHKLTSCTLLRREQCARVAPLAFSVTAGCRLQPIPAERRCLSHGPMSAILPKARVAWRPMWSHRWRDLVTGRLRLDRLAAMAGYKTLFPCADAQSSRSKKVPPPPSSPRSGPGGCDRRSPEVFDRHRDRDGRGLEQPGRSISRSSSTIRASRSRSTSTSSTPRAARPPA
jgi:hypothetical protein